MLIIRRLGQDKGDVPAWFPRERSDSVGQNSYGGFHSHGATPIAGWFTMEDPHDFFLVILFLGVPPLLETSIYVPYHSIIFRVYCSASVHMS